MTEHGIIMSRESILLYQAGLKTQTRRAVRNAEGAFWDHGAWHPVVENGRVVRWEKSDGMVCEAGAPLPRCPYGVPGDRLWFRETWGWSVYSPRLSHLDPTHPEFVKYKATDQQHDRDWWVDHWRSPIHMPRWAARYAPLLIDVRLERLQECSEADFAAEGGAFGYIPVADGVMYQWPTSKLGLLERFWSCRTPGECLSRALGGLKGEREPRGDSNPWVWVLTFEGVGR